MKFRFKPLALVLAALPCAAFAEETKLPSIVITAPRPAASTPSEAELNAARASTSDTASLLRDVPGVSLYGAGGVSSLPAIHGLADDRLNIKVDGVEIVASCPNHMNSALSYIDPSRVGSIKVLAGISPVSAGGDSIGGAIVVDAPLPQFASPEQGSLITGETGGFFRSNGASVGANLSVTLATEMLNATYTAAVAQADNYKAGGNFKTSTATSSSTDAARANHLLALDEVGSTAFLSRNQTFAMAVKRGSHLFEAKLGYQDIPYELYPTQRMDMLGNTEHRVSLRYLGQLDWGTVEARAYQQRVDHYMDFGPDKKWNYGSLTPTITTPMGVFTYTSGATYNVDGMPMYTKGKTSGASIEADVVLSKQNLLRLGSEFQAYRLDDWWPPAPNCGVGSCIGGMAPLTFWNINGGKRDRAGLFAEWEAKLSPQWLTLAGLRAERVQTDTGSVQGYNTSTTPLNTFFLKNMYESSSVGTRAAFNAMDRKRSDNNWDVTLLARNAPNAQSTFEYGYARKTRSPNLYERYDWSPNSMALEMNNFVGDGNGYLGNPDLKPEVANTVSFSGDWLNADRSAELKVAPYYTRVTNFVDAVRLPSASGMRGPDYNATVTNRFVRLQYANQSARLYGIDVSARAPLATTGVGELGVKGLLIYTNGKNLDTGDNLYNIMPLNAKLTLTQQTEGWDNGFELVGVKAKDHVSTVRNEAKTPGYALVNLRASRSAKNVRIDFGIENLFNRLYYSPLGGAYTGQGATMSFNAESGTIGTNGGTASLWGALVPGPGRSLYASINVKF